MEKGKHKLQNKFFLKRLKVQGSNLIEEKLCFQFFVLGNMQLLCKPNSNPLRMLVHLLVIQ